VQGSGPPRRHEIPHLGILVDASRNQRSGVGADRDAAYRLRIGVQPQRLGHAIAMEEVDARCSSYRKIPAIARPGHRRDVPDSFTWLEHRRFSGASFKDDSSAIEQPLRTRSIALRPFGQRLLEERLAGSKAGRWAGRRGAIVGTVLGIAVVVGHHHGNWRRIPTRDGRSDTAGRGDKGEQPRQTSTRRRHHESR
jgi:hypothetical protein